MCVSALTSPRVPQPNQPHVSPLERLEDAVRYSGTQASHQPCLCQTSGHARRSALDFPRQKRLSAKRRSIWVLRISSREKKYACVCRLRRRNARAVGVETESNTQKWPTARKLARPPTRRSSPSQCSLRHSSWTCLLSYCNPEWLGVSWQRDGGVFTHLFDGGNRNSSAVRSCPSPSPPPLHGHRTQAWRLRSEVWRKNNPASHVTTVPPIGAGTTNGRCVCVYATEPPFSNCFRFQYTTPRSPVEIASPGQRYNDNGSA